MQKDDDDDDGVKDIKAGNRGVLCLVLTLGMCAVSPQGLAGRDDDDFDYDDCGSIVIPSITQTSDVHCETKQSLKDLSLSLSTLTLYSVRVDNIHLIFLYSFVGNTSSAFSNMVTLMF